MKETFAKLYQVCIGFVTIVAIGALFLAASPVPYNKKSLHKAMHMIVLSNDDTAHRLARNGLEPWDKAGCTANAIAEHVLLTAQHCDLNDAVVYIDGSRIPYHISKKVFDGADHMLLVINDLSFKYILHYDPADYAAAVQGEQVMFWGNPRGIPDQYREGFCTGTTMLPSDELAPGRPVFIFAMPGAPGDSGSAILSRNDGRIVAILTYGIEGGKFAGGYALQFTKAQMAEAGL